MTRELFEESCFFLSLVGLACLFWLFFYYLGKAIDRFIAWKAKPSKNDKLAMRLERLELSETNFRFRIEKLETVRRR